jgi:hypothetical protein
VLYQAEYWIQEAQGRTPADPSNHWSLTVPGLVFGDRDDAEASVKRLQAKRPFRWRWPHGHVRLWGVRTPSRDEVAPFWWLRYWQYYELQWDRPPLVEEGAETTDFVELPEACLVPVRVVYRAVSHDYLRERGQHWETLQESATRQRSAFHARDYPPGKRMTDEEIGAIFATFSFYPSDS